jgi:hypothetical protein
MSWTDTRIALDKEDNGGRWILSSVSEDGSAVLRLRVSVGGHWDLLSR